MIVADASAVVAALLNDGPARQSLSSQPVHLGIRRHGCTALLARIWGLRDNLTAYDATHVALAEALGCPLLSADRRLAGAAGPQCAIHLVPG